MIPPFLLTLGGKIGMGVAAVAAVGFAIYAYNESLRSEGRSQERESYTEQIQKQAESVKQTDMAFSDQRLRDVERAVAEKDRFNAKLIQRNREYAVENARLKSKLSTPEVVHETEYITIEKPVSEPCVVSDKLLDRVDELARMLNDISDNRLPDADRASEQPVVQETGPAPCDTLVHRIEVLTARLGNSMIEHRQLSEYAVTQYQTYRQFQQGIKE